MQKKYEAREFLSGEKREISINRFKSKSDSVDFVEQLYKIGAIAVYVTGIQNYKSEYEMSVDQMIIELPKNKEMRHKLFDFCNKEIRNEGFDPEKDSGQKELQLWWD